MKNKYQNSIVYILILFCLTFLSFGAFFNIKAEAKMTTFLYAKVENDDVNLYKTPNATNENCLFAIPKSYFVLLLSNYNEMFYKAQYLDVVGFILKEQVSAVNETPNTPYAEATFYVFTTDGTTVMDSPTSFGKALTTIEKYENVTYYGHTNGEEKTKGRGTIWYYGKTKQGVFGYFYAGLCEINSSIPQNTEVVTTIANPFGESDNDYLYSLVDLTLGVKIVLLLLVLLPAIFLLLLAFKPNLFKKPHKKSCECATNSPKLKKTSNIKKIENYHDDIL